MNSASYTPMYKILSGVAFMPNSPADHQPNFPYSTRSHGFTFQVPFAHATSFFSVKPFAYGMSYH